MLAAAAIGLMGIVRTVETVAGGVDGLVVADEIVVAAGAADGLVVAGGIAGVAGLAGVDTRNYFATDFRGFTRIDQGLDYEGHDERRGLFLRQGVFRVVPNSGLSSLRPGFLLRRSGSRCDQI
jgi:hypothetical protein